MVPRRGFTHQVRNMSKMDVLFLLSDALVNGKVTYSVKMLGRKEVPEPKGSHVVRDAIHAIRFQLQVCIACGGDETVYLAGEPWRNGTFGSKASARRHPNLRGRP